MTVFRIGLLGIVGLISSVSLVRADVAAVNKYLTDAKTLIDQGPSYFDDATAKLDLAEGSMDDVPAADKAALQDKVKALRAQIGAAANANDKKSLQAKLKGALDQAEGAVGNGATWNGAAERVTTLLDDPRTAELLSPDELAAAKKQFATFQKVNGGKALKVDLANATQDVESTEKDWAELKANLAQPDMTPEGRDQAIGHFPDHLESLQKQLAAMPDDNADVKALHDRVAKIQTALASASTANDASAELAAINRYLDSYKDEFAGMDAETTPPTFKEFANGSQTTSEFNAPHTAAFVTRMSDYLAELPDTDSYKAAKDDPKVKALVADLQAKTAAGQAKLLKFGTAVVESLEKDKIDASGSSGSADVLKNSLERLLGKDKPETTALIARVDKVKQDFTNAGAAADAAKQAAYKTMSDAAAKAWPDMMAKFTVEQGFDPNNAGAMKGKYIKITTDNLMGSRFSPNDFPFATTLNGVPVAATYDPTVKAAIAEVEAKIGRSIGDDDNDGKWTVIARVEGSTGKLLQKIEHEADLTVDGSRAGTVSGTETRPVDAPIVTIVAAHCGPLAAAAGQGVVGTNGAIAAPVSTPAGSSLVPGAAPLAAAAGPGGPSVAGRLIAIVSSLLGLALGLACLMKAGFAPLATNAGAVNIQQKVGEHNLILLGLAGVAWGALGVVFGLLALVSAFFTALLTILMSAAMVIAGFSLSSTAFEQRQILKPDLVAKLRSLALPAGLACIVFSGLALIRNLIP